MSATEVQLAITRLEASEYGIVSAIVARSVEAMWPGHYAGEVIETVATQNTPEHLRQRSARQEDYLARRDGVPVGYVAVKRNEIGHLFVDPDAARQGVGAALVAFCERVLRGRGHHSVIVYASLNGLGFYEKQGYRRVETTEFELRPDVRLRCVLVRKDFADLTTVGTAQGGTMRKERPTLETERLVLRPFVLEDAPDVQRLAGAKAIALTTTNIPHPYEDGMAEQWIGTHQATFDAGSGVVFAITDRSDGALIGAIGLNVSAPHARAAMGYWIAEHCWGREYCTEAAAAVLRYGFETLDLNRILATHLSRNGASGHVMQKIGMTHEGRLRRHVRKWGSFEDMEQYAILKREYAEHRASAEP